MVTAVGPGPPGRGAQPLPSADAEPLVRRLRADRPEPEFAISMRTRWDALIDDRDMILAELDAYREVGITHLVPEPRQRSLDDYLRSIEATADVLRLGGVAMHD